MTDALKDTSPFSGHSPEQERPLGGYALLIGTYTLTTVAFATWFKHSGRLVPERVSTRDLILMTVATHKLTRIIARDRVTSVLRAPFTRFQDDAGPAEVDEAARGTGARRAVGELLVCPYCLGMWVATALTGAHMAAPRSTRMVTSAFAVVAGADLLQIGYAKAQSLI